MTELRTRATDLAHDLAALLWPIECVACGTPDRLLCADCGAALRRGEGRVRAVRTAAGGEALVAGPYAGALRALLVAHKHAGLTRAARVLGAQLRAPLRAALSRGAGSGEVLIVTVPSRAAALRRRGYRPVDLIVRAALRQERREPRGGGREGALAAPGDGEPRGVLLVGALRAKRGRTAQVGLDSAERLRNAARVTVARSKRRRLRGRTVVLVDDIVTTGATLLAAAAALEAAGAKVVASAAVCATERRDRREAVGSSPRPSASRSPSTGSEPLMNDRVRIGVVVRPAMRPPA